MYFVPVMIVLSIVAADAVHTNPTTNCWRLQLDWINDFANYEGTGALKVFNQLETKITVFVIKTNLRDITLRHHMRLPVSFDIRDGHCMKLTEVEGFCDERTTQVLFPGRSSVRDNKHRSDECYDANYREDKPGLG